MERHLNARNPKEEEKKSNWNADGSAFLGMFFSEAYGPILNTLLHPSAVVPRDNGHAPKSRNVRSRLFFLLRNG